MKRKKTYQWRFKGKGFPDAKSAGMELRRISNRNNGRLTPAAIVAAAADKTNVLHSCFEWDDTKAAERYRLYQARQLMACVLTRSEPTEPGDLQGVVEVRAFPSVPGNEYESRSYRPIELVMAEPDARERVIAEAKSRLDSWRREYQHLQEFAKITAAIDEFLSV